MQQFSFIIKTVCLALRYMYTFTAGCLIYAIRVIEMIQHLPQKMNSEFDSLFANYHDKVVTYLNSKISNYHDAQDLASEVFLYCYSHFAEYDPQKSSLSTWLYLIVNSRLKNYYRDQKVSSDIESIFDVLPDEDSDMDNCVYLEQLHHQVMDAILTLPERQKTIVLMSYFEEKSSQEIAAALGMSAVNVRVTLSRALKTLEMKYGRLFKGE